MKSPIMRSGSTARIMLLLLSRAWRSSSRVTMVFCLHMGDKLVTNNSPTALRGASPPSEMRTYQCISLERRSRSTMRSNSKAVKRRDYDQT